MTDYSWINSYIGIPYKLGGHDVDGFDCYGLVCAVMREQKNILLPMQGHFITSKLELLKSLTHGLLKHVEFGDCYCVEQLQDFDIFIQRRNRLVTHIGVWIANGLLHADECAGAVVFDDRTALRLKSYNEGAAFFRWQL